MSSGTEKRDIENIHDVELLVNTFYDRVNVDTLLGPIFNEQAKVHWARHLPTMYQFWSSILLGSRTYQGQPFPKHIPFNLQKHHFDRWIELFYGTLDDLFEGPTANHAKYRADLISQVFQSKLQHLSAFRSELASQL